MKHIKLILLLVTLTLTAGCGDGSGAGPGSVVSYGDVSGEFANDFFLENGGHYVVTLKMSNGSFVVRDYIFDSSNTTVGRYVERRGTYTFDGSVYHQTYTYNPCNTVQPQPFTIDAIDNITYKFNALNSGIESIYYKFVLGVNTFLVNDIGMQISQEIACDEFMALTQ